MFSRKTLLSSLLAQLMFSGTSSLRSYEERCVSWLEQFLSVEANSILKGQIRAAILIDRGMDDKIVTFNTLQRQVDVLLFPNSAPELHLATLNLKASGVKGIRCDFMLHLGKLSSIEFSVVPRRFSEKELILTSCKMWADPMQQNTEIADVPLGIHQPQRGGCLEAINSITTVTNIAPPATETEVVSMLSRLSICTPSDWGSLVYEANGFECENCRFLGTQTKTLVHSGATYVYLAESAYSALAVKQGDTSCHVYYHDEINDEFYDSGLLFIPAFIKFSTQDL